jgi:predicted DNA-binding transcriptional regulator YafY
MSRAERLLQLMQALRRHRFPVSGASLASERRVSLRTLYRDIDSLQAQGAMIDGEAGVGYVLRPGFMLPPLMFSEEEIEALVLGSRWVADRGDSQLGDAARNAISKIAAVFPMICGLRWIHRHYWSVRARALPLEIRNLLRFGWRFAQSASWKFDIEISKRRSHRERFGPLRLDFSIGFVS